MGLSFTIAAGPRERNHSQVRVPWDSWTYFSVSDSRLPQPGGPGPRIYIPQEQGGPVRLYPQALGPIFVASYNLQGNGGGIRLRLHTGIFLRNSGPISFNYILNICYDTDRRENTAYNSCSITGRVSVDEGMCLPSRCLSTFGG
jgi:hypothetical protein